MGQVAERAGIGRATLYKYFGGVEEILVAAHAEHVNQHPAQLDAARAAAKSAGEGLNRMLVGYAGICFHRGKLAAPDLRGLVHSGGRVSAARHGCLTFSPTRYAPRNRPETHAPTSSPTSLRRTA